jgi:hypothetical protein
MLPGPERMIPNILKYVELSTSKQSESQGQLLAVTQFLEECEYQLGNAILN